MIPSLNIVAWGATVPWAALRQVEQDLLISRAIIKVFRDPFLRRELRFRGGTALNKLHFPAPLRYSEDMDFVRTTAGPIGPILDRIRSLLEPWLGHAGFDQSPVAPKLRFRVPAEDDPTTQIRYYFLLGRTVTMSEAPSVRGARAVKLIAIGNSKGIRLPKALIQKYGWSDSLVLEETVSFCAARKK